MVDLRFAAAVAGATGVGIGAFGAHALKATLEALPSGKGVDTFRTGNLYHLVHAAALLALSTSAPEDAERNQRPATLFITGICLFSGSLYVGTSFVVYTLTACSNTLYLRSQVRFGAGRAAAARACDAAGRLVFHWRVDLAGDVERNETCVQCN